MSAELPTDLVERLRERANEPDRRSDAASLSAHTVSLDSLLGQLGAANPQLQAMQGLMGQFADVMKGFGVVAPMPGGGQAPQRQPEPLPAPATDEQIASAEKSLGRSLPAGIAQLYREIADGGFGPGGGLFPVSRAIEEYEDMTSEPAGPQNQPWPPNLLPLIDAEPGYDCIDLDSGEIVAWDPEEIEGYSNAAWKRSFKPAAPSLAAWLEQWLSRPTAGERMQQQHEQVAKHPMEFHVRNMIESYGRMSPEERAAHGLPAENWEEAVRRRFIP